jgi:DNA-binding transcriptional regulator YiaG
MAKAKDPNQIDLLSVTPTDIRRLRHALGDTYRAFAQRLRTSNSTVYRWEAGKRIPGPGYRLVLASLLREAKRVGWLIDRERPPARLIVRVDKPEVE